MSNRKHAGSYVLPDNPTWLEFPRSDGSPQYLPQNTTKVVDSEGQVNYMRPVSFGESLSNMWRVTLGVQLAARMQLPEGPKYVLKSFPDGYQLYDHNKGPEKAPRHDPYLCGSANVNRFRSVNEFTPHALWLMQDPTMLRANCSCKYCSKQPQRIITDTMGLSGRRSASAAVHTPSRAPRAKREREARETRLPAPPTKPYAAVRRAPKPFRLLVGPDQHISPERDLDVRMSLGYAEGHRPRWFRKGELVWCHLELPIRGRIPEEDIMFWPGIVEDIHIKTQAIPMMSPSADVNMEHLYAEAADDNPALGVPPGDASAPGTSGSLATAPAEAQADVPWTVQQWYVYKTKLLATALSFFVTDEQVLPYLAYAPSDDILRRVNEELSNCLQAVSIQKMDQDLEHHMFDFDPMRPEPNEGGHLAKYKDAAAPYTLAIQVASNIAQFWLPTDEWDCKFTIPHPTPSSSLPSSQEPAQHTLQYPPNISLHAVIQHAMNGSATSSTAVSGPKGLMKEGGSISMLGSLSRSAATPTSVTQTRFQGLWWGTERIWTDELVRLKIARCQFAPKGTNIIYPPAGPSASTLADLDNNPLTAGANPDSLGSSEKGLFLRLEGLFVVEVPSANGIGTTRECRASGMVYELVDHDWEDNDNSAKENDIVVDAGNDKGEARGQSDVPMSISRPTSPRLLDKSSPLKPPTLPNPVESASAMSQAGPAAVASQQDAKAGDLNVQLSHPVLSTPYPLPPAPRGFKFRPILPPGHEVVISMSLISGRYYPGLLYHPLMGPTVHNELQKASQEGGLFRSRHLWAMEGLLPGIHQSMEPRFWRGSRIIMLQEADKEARGRFKEHWEDIKMQRLHPDPPAESSGDVSMEVD